MAEVPEQPQNDFEAVQSFIKDQVKTYFDEMAASQSQLRQQSQQQPSTEQHYEQQIRENLEPFIAPTRLIARDAQDESRFYRRNPDASEYEKEIEDAFDAAMKAGRPTSREVLYDYVRGKEMRAEPEKFAERQEKRRQAQLERVEPAVDFGVGAINRAKNDPTFSNFSSLPLEDMEKALEGVTF